MSHKTKIITACALFIIAISINAQKNDESIAASKVEKIAGNFKFTEGPAADAQGNVYFTDIPNHLILAWTINNELDTFRTESGRANGLFFDKAGNLYVCEGQEGRISLTTSKGVYKVIAKQYNGKRFNQPNDLWVDLKGGIYFTDPKYGSNDTLLDQDGMHVYYIKPNGEIIRVCDDLIKPNGIIGSADARQLYITDAQAGKTFKYAINDDGTLADKKLFIELGCDGMTIDINNNLYLTPRGSNNIEIYSPNGILLESIEVNERPSNVCFGGKKNNELFITARTSLYRVKTNTKGAR